MKNTRVWIDYTKLRNALVFGTVLNHYNFEYKEGQIQIKICCPFHDDQKPSLSINTEDGIWRCFSCPAKGNCLEFVTMMEGEDPDDMEGLYKGAVTAVDIMGENISTFSKSNRKKIGPDSPKAKEKNKIKAKGRGKATKAVSDDSGASEVSPKTKPPKSNPVLDLKLSLDHEHFFLTDRGITPEVAKKFGVGFCPKGMMKNRITFPIHNEGGELVAYCGRWADEELPEETDRYKFPKGFSKSLVLYNLHQAKLFKKRHLVMVEGFWSVIRLHEEGIPVVSCFGTSCSDEQASLILKAGFHYVTIILDGDEAGRKAISEMVTILSSRVYVRSLELPEGEKPDTMSEKWFEKLR
jgi:DNA primase